MCIENPAGASLPKASNQQQQLYSPPLTRCSASLHCAFPRARESSP